MGSGTPLLSLLSLSSSNPLPHCAYILRCFPGPRRDVENQRFPGHDDRGQGGDGVNEREDPQTQVSRLLATNCSANCLLIPQHTVKVIFWRM